MKFSIFVINAAWVAIVQAWSHEWHSEYDSRWTGQEAQKVIDGSCKVSHVTAFEMSKTKDPIFFSRNGEDHPISPKMVPLNGTAGEQVTNQISISVICLKIVVIILGYYVKFSNLSCNKVGNRWHLIRRHAIFHVRFLPRSKLCNPGFRQSPHQH